jgi:hypothetical protein
MALDRPGFMVVRYRCSETFRTDDRRGVRVTFCSVLFSFTSRAVSTSETDVLGGVEERKM